MSIRKVSSLLLLCLILLISPGRAFPQPQGEGSSLDAGEVTLDELLKAAAESNPELKAAAHSAAASKAMIPAAGALPEPTVSFETMGKLIPPKLMAGDPSSARTYGVEQEIPFPGKRGLKENIASAEADSQQFNHQLVHLKTMSELKQAFFELYFAHKSIETLMKNKDLLANFTQIAESRYKVGQTIQQDVLKAQVESSKILDRLLVQGQKKRTAEAKINSILYRPAESPVGKPAEFKKAELALSLEELTQLALNASPTIKVQESEISRRQYGVQLAQKEFYPDFAVGFTYYERDQNPEMYRLMVSAKVPIYFWRKQQPELEAARLNLSSARSMRDNANSTVRYQVKEAYTTVTTSDKLAKLYSSAIVPQANLALSSAIANYQVGKIDFLQLIDASMALLEYELKYYESITEFHKALAQMEPLVGMDLVR